MYVCNLREFGLVPLPSSEPKGGPKGKSKHRLRKLDMRGRGRAL